MNTLIIRHTGEGDQPRFCIVRGSDGKSTTKANPVASPVGFPVKGRPTSDLVHELRWYLETFLGYPFPPDTDRADRVLEALKKWGRDAFDALG